MKKINFKDWIEKLGAGEVAERLGVAKSTVRHWRNGRCLPKSTHMEKIKRISKGAVTYDAIIDGRKRAAR